LRDQEIMHKVYVLENRDDKSWNIGQTDDIESRLQQDLRIELVVV